MKLFYIRRSRGFNLIELMIVVAIIGILSSIAVPAYTDYTQRARASSSLSSVQAWQTAVNLCWQTEGTMNVCNTFGQNGIPALPQNDTELPQGINAMRAGTALGSMIVTLAAQDRDGDDLVVELTPEPRTTHLAWLISCSDYNESISPHSRVSQCDSRTTAGSGS